MQSSANLTTDIYVRHSVGSRELFRAITRLQADLHTVVVGRLPASEGLGFSLVVEEGGSGYREICTYGFRFQHGVVSYRTLAARAETREGGISAGDVTDWKSVLTQAQRSPSPPTAAANRTTVTETTPIAANGRPGYGDVIGEFRGVVARSNGDCTATLLGKCGSDNTWKQYALYQCVDYAKRFYQEHYRTVAETQAEWKDAISFWSRTTHPNLLKYLNGNTNSLPKPGDMIFFDTGYSEGHVAIVRLVSVGRINIIQQNVKRETAYAEVSYKTEPNGLIRLADGMRFPDGSLSKGTMRPLGWLSLREKDRSTVQVQRDTGSQPAPAGISMPANCGRSPIDLSGNWELRRKNYPRGNPVASMTLTFDNIGIIAKGSSWTGQGRFDGCRGYYDWEFADGKRGRTTIALDSAGALLGSVRGSGLDWDYIGTRVAAKPAASDTHAPLDRQWLGKWKGREPWRGSKWVASLDISPTAIQYRSSVGDEGQYHMETTKYKWSPLQDGLRARAVPSGSLLFSSSQNTRAKAEIVKEFEANKAMFADVPGSANARRTETEAIQRMRPGGYPVILLYTNGEINELVLDGDHIWFLPGEGMGTELFSA
jgi:hypothetical protein